MVLWKEERFPPLAPFVPGGGSREAVPIPGSYIYRPVLGQAEVRRLQAVGNGDVSAL